MHHFSRPTRVGRLNGRQELAAALLHQLVALQHGAHIIRRIHERAQHVAWRLPLHMATHLCQHLVIAQRLVEGHHMRRRQSRGGSHPFLRRAPGSGSSSRCSCIQRAAVGNRTWREASAIAIRMGACGCQAGQAQVCELDALGKLRQGHAPLVQHLVLGPVRHHIGTIMLQVPHERELQAAVAAPHNDVVGEHHLCRACHCFAQLTNQAVCN
mmetsp:Transcript_13212/g.35392  ORF Transcript_13212/g.35392 Transcript_13212/m.35392 type:complete len:212 (-) Transcript_13212:314-949(-)